MEGLNADFIMNAEDLFDESDLFEDNEDKDAIRAAYEKIFKTKTGKHICSTMFGI